MPSAACRGLQRHVGGVAVTWFADGSPYAYLAAGPAETVNVGWLDASHPFHDGEPSPGFLAALFDLCAKPINKTRGWHKCEFCDQPVPLAVESDGLQLLLGSAEIRVMAPGGQQFAAPDLVYHYVRDHRYSPPDDFVAAVVAAGAS